MNNNLKHSIQKFQKMGEDIKSSLSKRGAWGGWYKVLTELYPDNAHFLFELLQNAEDADATRVKFELEDSSLVFKHNGTREFSESDIDSITNIGDSNKTVNKIGKFGVGFKSVFSYTESPKIHTKAISFEIEDLVIPFLIKPKPIEKGFTTVFIFNFDKSDRPKKKAFREVNQFFDELEESILLFLTNIRSIEWCIKKRKPVSITMQDKGDFKEIITSSLSQKKNKDSVSSWLVFQKKVKVANKFRIIGIAFSYNKEKKQLQGVDGNVSIYFPAKKESSKLRFHIDAPFSSTVARDSIVDSSEENIEMLSRIGELCAEKVHKIKQLGLLKMSFFEILPNIEDPLSKFYRPIFDTLKEQFDSDSELIPLGKGKFASINNCLYVLNSAVKNIFNEKEDINIIFDNDSLVGYATLPRRNSRSYRFLEALDGFEESEDDEIYERLEGISDAFKDFERHKDKSWWFSEEEKEELQIQTEWLKNKSDEWLQSLYAFLGGDKPWSYSSFIKLADNSFNFSDKSLYFPEKNLSIDAALTFVNINTYTSGDNNGEKEKALEFLLSENVRYVDESTHLEFLFDDFKFVSKKQHLDDINRLIAFYIDNKKDAADLMRYGSFIYSENYIEYIYELNGEDKYDSDPLASPSQVFIDSPYESTGLDYIFTQTKTFFKVSEIYKKLDNWPAFIDLLKELGANSEIEIDSASIYDNPNWNVLAKAKGERHTYTTILKDWTIDNLEELLMPDEYRFEISKLLWEKLCTTKEEYFFACYRVNSAYDAVYTDSQLKHTLKSYKWIPGKDGDFYKPAEISREMLHPDLTYENSNRWLDHLGFGEAVAEKLKEDEVKKQVLIDTGIDPEIAVLLSSESPEAMKDFLADYKAKKLKQSLEGAQGSGKSKEVATFDGPGSEVNDPEGLEEKIGKDIDSSPAGGKPINQTRSAPAKDSKNIDEIKRFLYGQYHGHCQICGDTFMEKKNKNFFELYSLNRSKKGDRLKSDINREGNSLSLCPKHHAILTLGIQKFTFLDKISSSDLNQSLLSSLFEIRDYVTNEADEFYNAPESAGFYLEDALMLPIEIFGEDHFIKFSEEHMIHFIQVFIKR